MSDLPRTVTKYMDICFDNVPCLKHLAVAHRSDALRQYRTFEEEMRETPVGLLHNAVSGENTEPRRWQLAFLIAKFCLDTHFSYEQLFECLKSCGGPEVLGTKGLINTNVTTSGKAVINLLTMIDIVLLNVYYTIPSHQREVEKPKAPPTLKIKLTITKKKRRKRSQFAEAEKKHRPKPRVVRELVPKEETFVWVECERCAKWRRLFGHTEEDVPEKWICAMNPQKMTCADPEDIMAEDEQWDGEVKDLSNPVSTSASRPTSDNEDGEDDEDNEDGDVDEEALFGSDGDDE